MLLRAKLTYHKCGLLSGRKSMELLSEPPIHTCIFIMWKVSLLHYNLLVYTTLTCVVSLKIIFSLLLALEKKIKGWMMKFRWWNGRARERKAFISRCSPLPLPPSSASFPGVSPCTAAVSSSPHSEADSWGTKNTMNNTHVSVSIRVLLPHHCFQGKIKLSGGLSIF